MISARSEDNLEEAARRHVAFLESGCEGEALLDVCFTAAVRRVHNRYALAVVGSSTAELIERIEVFLSNERDPSNFAERAGRATPPLAFVFPGARAPGIGPELLAQEIAFTDAVGRCERAFGGLVGFSVLEALAVADAPEHHVLTFSVGFALSQLWRRFGVLPDRVGGEGIGLLAARCAVGEVSLNDARSELVGPVRSRVGGNPVDVGVRGVGVLREGPNDLVLYLGTGAEDDVDDRVLELRPDGDERRRLLETAAALWLAGRPICWRALFPAGARVVALPSTPWRRRRLPRELPDHGGVPGAAPTNGGRRARTGAARVKAPDGLLTAVRDRAALIIGLEPAELDPGRPLVDFGLGSLMATELREIVARDLGVELPLAALAKGASVAEVTALARDAPPSAAAALSDPATAAEPFALTAIQHAYWVGRSSEYALGGVACHAYLEFESADFDPGRFTQALNTLIIRHEMLRAVVNPDGGQRVLPVVPRYEPRLVDLRDADDVEGDLQRLRTELSHQVLPADRWPLFEFWVIALASGITRVLVSLDLLIADAASLMLLSRELGLLYRDPDARLPSIGITFRDYLAAIRAPESQPAAERDRRYWFARLDTLPPGPRLPLACEPGDLGLPRFVRRAARLDAEQWRQLRGEASRDHLTGSGLLCAAFAEVLRRFSGGAPLTLNLATHNRQALHPEIDRVIGDFTSVTLLEARGAGTTFRDRAEELQSQLWQDLEHRSFDGVSVLHELARRHGPERGAMPVVFTSTLGLDSEPGLPFEQFGEIVHAISQTPQVWLDHQVFEREDTVELTWDAVEGLFPPGFLDAMFGAYLDLLGRLASGDGWDDPSPVRLPASEDEAVRRANATHIPVVPGLLHTLAIERAASTPEQLAVIAGECRLTYAELERRSAAVAASLAGHTGERVVVAMRRGWEQVVALLGVLRAGAAYVPLDPDTPPERLQRLIARAQARVALTQPELVATVAWPEGTNLLAVSDEPPSGEAPPQTAHPRDLAYVIFTSGSTGEPKGVMISHEAALNTIIDVNRRFDVGAGDRVLALSALWFDLSVWDVFGTLAAGGTIVILDPDRAGEPAHWVELAERHRVTTWNSVPALMTLALDRAATLRERLPPSLRLVMLSGDWIPLALPPALRERSNAALFSLGGATEAAIWSIFHPVDGLQPGWSSVPYGRPLANQSFHVLGQDMEECPAWVPGELCIAGSGLALGYWQDPERTAAAFITHPRTGEALYRTGDLGLRRPDGVIEFLGRADAQVKINGYRIELGEVEAALTSHPDISQAICAALGAREERRLAAFYTTTTQPLAHAELGQFLAEQLPRWMIPSSFTAIEEIPLNANGKVDRSKLPDPVAAHSNARGDSDTDAELLALIRRVDPGNGTPLGGALLRRALALAMRQDSTLTIEDVAAAAVCERLRCEVAAMLDLDPDGLSFAAPLNSVGLNSIKAVELSNVLERDAGVGLPLSMVTEGRSLAEIAARIAPRLIALLQVSAPESELRSETDRPGVLDARPSDRHEPFPLTAIQEAYWVGRTDAYDLGGVSCHVYLELNSPALDCGRLTAALNRLIARHAMLRAVIDPDGRQRVLEHVPRFEPTVVDLRGRSGAEADHELERMRDERSHRVHVAEQWPLFDVTVALLGGGRARVLLSLDLLIADGASLFIFGRELEQLYRNPDAKLDEVGVTFRDYVLAQRAVEHGAQRREDWDYWLERLDELPPAPRLPLTIRPAEVGVPRFVRRSARLLPEQWVALRGRAASERLTASTVLCTAFGEVLGRCDDGQPLTLNLTTYNRRAVHGDIAGVIGDFTSLTLLALDGSGTTFRARARLAQEQLWRDLEHRGVDGVEVMRELGRLRGRSRGTMPVVFTSTLGLDQDSEGFPLESLGTIGYGISQTPQVWLDHQVLERDGGLDLTWDAVDDLFAPGLLDVLFDAYLDLLQRLGTAESWDQDNVVALTPDQVQMIALARAESVIPYSVEPVDALPRRHDPPSSEVDEALVERLSEVIAIALGCEHVDPLASLEDLGATSTEVARLQPRVSAELGVEVSLRDLVTAPSIVELAEKLSLVSG